LTTPETTSENATAPAEGNEPAWYREQIETSKARNAELQAKLERLAYSSVGLNPSEGMGKAIAMTFDGSPDPENLDPLIEHAKKEFDLDLSVGASNASEASVKPETSAAEARIGALDNASIPTEPNVLQDEADAKLNTGDTEGAIAAMLGEQIAAGKLDVGGPEQP
jgi:hypothetical protein